MNPEIDVLEEVLTVEETVDKKDLIVFNDDVNSFDHVINSLIKVCKHKPIQAEQCTFIVHYKGKCQVKRGDYEQLEPMCVALHDRGISAEIQ
ncbi:MAG: ATP-dependent Clp protease adaptor ClpS [Crocinitomicaceae bacterium]|nr:ATP-dependent Clp protease adaptor ClpS [Flavobacteriales bacterium]NQZ37873.1 ATP-dependent Clp protease adaptor ClpS [Crocinitomicaceae bacterium]